MRVVVYRVGETVKVLALPPGAEDATLLDDAQLPARAERGRWRLAGGKVVLASPVKSE